MDYYTDESQKNARKSKWYDDITRTLTKCPFCDLKEKYVITEKADVVLTVNLFPYIDGHMMVIPRRHFEDFSCITQKEWESTKQLLDLGIRLLREGIGVEDVNLLYREGSKSGNSLKHFHIHILPITPDFMSYQKQKFVWNFQDINYAPQEMAEKLRKLCQKIKTKK